MSGRNQGAPTSLAAVTLLGLGVVITVLGLLAAGSVMFTALGLASIAVAGVLEIAGRRAAPRMQADEDESEGI